MQKVGIHADNNNMNDSEHDAFNFAIILILLCLQQINKCMYVSKFKFFLTFCRFVIIVFLFCSYFYYTCNSI